MDDQAPGRSAARRARAELERARDIRLAPVGAAIAGALIGWGAIFLKAMLVEAIDGDPGYIVLMAAVIAAAWVGGWTGGVVAVAIALILDWLIFVSPVDPTSAMEGRVEAARLVLFAVVSLATVGLIGSRRASRDRLADALDEAADLAAKVEARDERLELMLAASGTGFWEWDVASGELLWSVAIFEQHGLAAAPTAPDFATYLHMIHPDDRDRFTAAIDAAMTGSAPFSIEFRVVWPDGSIHWTHGAARVFRDGDGRPTRMLGTGQDITERRRVADERDRLLAEERRAAEFREAFIDVISHELRTPITTIMGISQILTRPGRADDAATRTPLLEDVRSESERLHRLVEDLLVMSRVERGGLTVDAEPIEPRRLLERVVAHEAVELPSIDIELHVDADLPIVAGEATYVEQIVRNLLGNAAKYTPAGTRVVVRVGRQDDEVAIRVLDEGPGVPAASIDRIFELFYRDPDSARTVAGSGIGLFVCASLVGAMGGRIWATRRPEGGSEFGFTLRILTADDDDADRGRTGGSARAAETRA